MQTHNINQKPTVHQILLHIRNDLKFILNLLHIGTSELSNFKQNAEYSTKRTEELTLNFQKEQ